MEKLEKLYETKKAEVEAALQNLCKMNKEYGYHSEESRRWREILRKDRQALDVIERSIELKGTR